MPASRPNAARAYRYGPPASPKRDATSAKHATTTLIPAAASSQAHGLTTPSLPAMTDGRPKTLLPMTLLSTRATSPQRPMARTSVGLTRGDSGIPRAPPAFGASLPGAVGKAPGRRGGDRRSDTSGSSWSRYPRSGCAAPPSHSPDRAAHTGHAPPSGDE